MITPRTHFDMSEASSPAPSPPRPLVTLIALLLGVASGACGANTPNEVVDTIDRETFIEVYVDLRSVALRKTSRKVNAVERDSLLAMHEVTEENPSALPRGPTTQKWSSCAISGTMWRHAYL